MNHKTRVYENVFEMMPSEENPTPLGFARRPIFVATVKLSLPWLARYWPINFSLRPSP